MGAFERKAPLMHSEFISSVPNMITADEILNQVTTLRTRRSIRDKRFARQSAATAVVHPNRLLASDPSDHRGRKAASDRRRRRRRRWTTTETNDASERLRTFAQVARRRGRLDRADRFRR